MKAKAKAKPSPKEKAVKAKPAKKEKASSIQCYFLFFQDAQQLSSWCSELLDPNFTEQRHFHRCQASKAKAPKEPASKKRKAESTDLLNSMASLEDIFAKGQRGDGETAESPDELKQLEQAVEAMLEGEAHD